MEILTLCEKLSVQYKGKYTKIALDILADFSVARGHHVAGFVVTDLKIGNNVKTWILKSAEKLGIELFSHDVEFCLPHNRFTSTLVKLYR